MRPIRLVIFFFFNLLTLLSLMAAGQQPTDTSRDRISTPAGSGVDIQNPFQKPSLPNRREIDEALQPGNAARLRELLQRYPEAANAPLQHEGTLLTMACRHGNSEAVKILLEYKPDLNQPGSHVGSGEAPLHIAVRNQREQIVRLLIEAKADVNLPSSFGKRPLDIAIETRNPATTLLLVKHGASIFLTAQRLDQFSPLIQSLYSRDNNIFDLVLTNNLEITTADKTGNTLLHYSVIYLRKSAAAQLLKKNASVHSLNQSGFTPLQAMIYQTFTSNWGPPSQIDPASERQQIADLLVGHGATMDILSAAALGRKDTLTQILNTNASAIATHDFEKRTPLHWAALSGDSIIAKQLISSGATIIVTDQKRRSPLHEAAAQGNRPMVELLLEHGNLHSQKDSDGNTPLHLAMQSVDPSIAELLIETGTDVNALNNLQKTPLELASERGLKKIVQLLFNKGASLQRERGRNDNVLHAAVRSRNFDLAQLLLNRGAHINGLNRDGKTPLHIANESTDREMLAFLMQQGADLNAQDTNGNTILHYQIKNASDWDIVRPTRLHQDHSALEPVEPTFFELLVKQAPNARATNRLGQTALHFAAARDTSNSSSSNAFIHLISLLKNLGADLNAPDIHGRTALHYAASSNRIALAEALLKAGVTVDFQDHQGRTPLHDCPGAPSWQVSITDEAPPSVLSLLLKFGANLNSQDNTGLTPLHLAMVNESSGPFPTGSPAQVVRSFLAAKPDPNIKDKNGRTPLHRLFIGRSDIFEISQLAQALTESGANWNFTDVDGKTPLHYLAMRERLPMIDNQIDQIIPANAEINVRDKQGNTPLHYAAQNKNPSLFALLERRGASLAARNAENVTPLELAQKNPIVLYRLPQNKGIQLDIHRAAQEADFEALERLIATDTNLLRAVNPMKQTPLQIALQNQNLAVAEFLLKKGAALEPFAAAALGRKEVLAAALKKDAELANRPVSNRTLLSWAAEYGQLDTVDMLLEQNADPLLTDHTGKTPLYLAIANGHHTVAESIRRRGGSNDIYAAAALGDAAWLARLLEQNATNVHSQCQFGWTPFHCAARFGQVETMKLLLRHGATVDSRESRMKWTPLHCAAFEGHYDACKLLIENKADVNAENAYGLTPLHHASMRGHPEVAELLISHKADINASDDTGQTPLNAARLAAPQNPKLRGSPEWENRKQALIKLLVDKGAKDHGFAPRRRPFGAPEGWPIR